MVRHETVKRYKSKAPSDFRSNPTQFRRTHTNLSPTASAICQPNQLACWCIWVYRISSNPSVSVSRKLRAAKHLVNPSQVLHTHINCVWKITVVLVLKSTQKCALFTFKFKCPKSKQTPSPQKQQIYTYQTRSMYM